MLLEIRFESISTLVDAVIYYLTVHGTSLSQRHPKWRPPRPRFLLARR